MRAVVDPNVLISALLSHSGAPARILRAWLDGAFELVASPLLITELERALSYPKLRRRVPTDEAKQYVAWIVSEAEFAGDPSEPPGISSEDPGDDYLIALATNQRAALVSGDRHLHALSNRLPVFTPAQFWDLLVERGLTANS